MRAAIFNGPGNAWSVEDAPDPAPDAGELVIKVEICGICGSDVHMTSGKGMTLPTGCIAGHEYAGEVVALGSDVDRLKVGDKVAAMPFSGCGLCRFCQAGEQLLCERKVHPYVGGFAEYVLARASNTIRISDSLPMSEGALIEPYAVGYHGVNLALPLRGKKVLVIGVGAIGLGVIAALVLSGAEKIVGYARSESRRALTLQAGANGFVAQSAQDRQEVADILGGRPDVVFECIGAPGALDLCLRFLAPNGTVVSLGHCAEPDPISVVKATSKQARLVFSSGYTLAEFKDVADHLANRSMQVRNVVTEVVGLGDVGSAILGLQNGTRAATKIQVAPWMN